MLELSRCEMHIFTCITVVVSQHYRDVPRAIANAGSRVVDLRNLMTQRPSPMEPPERFMHASLLAKASNQSQPIKE